MLNCGACRRRAILSIINDLQNFSTNLPSHPRLRSNKSASPVNLTLIRGHATVQSIKQGHHRRMLLKALAKKAPPPPNTHRNRLVPTAQARDERARLNNANLLTNPEYEKEVAKKAAYEVQFLTDPLKLATATLAKLRDGKLIDALELVRASEKVPNRDEHRGDNSISAKTKVDNVVSWNHIMDYCMENGDPRTALKIYNEMKKRSHRPDAHTYTIILRGFSKNIRTPNAVKDAVHVYNSIFAPNSLVKPSTIHTNAIVNVCARGGDMDSLWAVAGRLPEKGSGAPDMWTYTTILNAIQNDARKRATQLMATQGSTADTTVIVQEAINDGRRMWVDIVTRWRKGDIKMDEPLVCAMGRLLLLSTQRKDIDDLFRLVEQTMNVTFKQTVAETTSDDTTPANERDIIPTNSIAEISSSANKEIYAVPGNNTLSMLIEAATVVKQIHVGKQCWDLLTSERHRFHVVPDVQNIIAYLRLLRISRASKLVLDLLRQEWPDDVADKLYTRGTFVIAMSTCVRDKNNPNVFDTAGRILDLMQDKANKALTEAKSNSKDEDKTSYMAGQTLEIDPKVIAMYLNLAMVASNGVDTGRLLGMNNKGVMDLDGDPRWKNTLRALKRLGPDLVNVRRLAKLKIAELEHDNHFASQQALPRKRQGFVDVNHVAEKLDDLVGLLRAMISAYDRVIGVNFRLEEQKKPPLDRNFLNDCVIQKKKLAALITKVDEDIVVRVGRSGLKEQYDPAKVKDNIDETEDAEDLTTDSMFQRTPAQSKWAREAWKIGKENETQQENKRLSRRQVQEKEKTRRAERLQRMYPGPRGTVGGHRRRDITDSGMQTSSGLVQQGWGSGYNDLAEKMGQRGTSGVVDLG